MASKPSVTLTLAGDEKKLTESFDRVGASSKTMSDTVEGSSRGMQDAGKRFDDLAEKSDTVDTRAMGFRDTVTGVSDSLKGLTDSSLSTEERLLTLGMGLGDLASGFTNLLIPAMGNLATFMRGGLASAMTFIAAHPLLLALGLLAVAFVVLWTQSETFRNIVIGVFNAVAGVVRNVFGGAIQRIIDRWNDVVGFFGGLPDRIGRAIGSLGGIIHNAFKGAANTAIDAINWLIHRANDFIGGINWLTRQVGIPGIPGIPTVARLHQGGTVPGAPGTEMLAILEAGETVTPAGQSRGGDLVVSFVGDTDGAFVTAFMNLVRTGQIQINLGGA